MNVGDAIPPLERTLRLVDLVAYAGATWDWHRLHYDPAYLEPIGLERPVVDGQQLGALMAEHVMDHLGPAAFPARMAFRFTSMVFADDTVRVTGEVSEVDGDEVTVTQTVSVGDRVAAKGHTTVRLARGAGMNANGEQGIRGA